ncbi:MAG: dTMP kinase [Nitrospirae bacterium RIFCSPLOW2_12_42_9]|nr:MAG: dTMP kinase [Nitrospirae bacterium RIFCSPLOW2_12_42_9]
MKGIFITFEGIEGCGKTTQAHLLAGYLEEQGYKVLKTREPGGTEISEAVREILLSNDFVKMHPHTEVLLYLASRAQHISDKIKPALEKGMIVISDRFSDSTFVYQCYVRGIDYQIVEEMNSFTTEGISPDITFVLDLEPEEGLRRAVSRNQKHSRKEDRMEKESLEFHQKVREGYLKMAERYPDRIHVISSNRDKTEVQEEIKGIVGRILSQRGFPG